MFTLSHDVPRGGLEGGGRWGQGSAKLGKMI